MLSCACCGRQMPPQCLYCAICGARMPHPLAAGGVVIGGRFQIQRLLSVRGQHLATFLGVEGGSGQPVVVKELRDDLRVDAAQQHETQEEIRRLSGLQVPGILPIRGVVPHEGRTYLVMPYLQGMTLRQMLAKQGRLTVEQAASVLRAVVTILDALHQQFPPMLHLDVTPDHILLAGWDRAMLLDGAWLKALGNPFPHRPPLYAIDYAAPEVARGQAVPASDFYSLGVTILEALTGIPAARLHNAYANRVAWEALPHPGLNDLLMRLVDGSLSTRYGTAAQVMQGLQAAMTGQPVPGAAPPAPAGFGQPGGFGPPAGFGAPAGFGQPAQPMPPQPMQPQQAQGGWGAPQQAPGMAQQPAWGAPQGMPQQPMQAPPQPMQAPPQPMQAPPQPMQPPQQPPQAPLQPPRPAYEPPKLTASAQSELAARGGPPTPAAPPATPPAPAPAAPPPAPAPPPRKDPPKIVDNIDDVSTEEGLDALMALYEAQNS